jgi:hypothetical protein
MKRLLRILLYSMMVVSLMLWVATALLWVRARSHSDIVGWAGWKDEQAGLWQGWGVSSKGGVLTFYGFSGTYQFDDPSNVQGSVTAMRPHFFHRAGAESRPPRAFRYEVSSYGGNGLGFGIRTHSLPLWFLFVAFGANTLFLPSLRLVRRALAARHRRRPERRGFAPICDDDVAGGCGAHPARDESGAALGRLAPCALPRRV